MAKPRPETPTVSVAKALMKLADPKDATFLQRFFKTGPGQYGEGDVFLGIRVPATRTLARAYRDLSPAQIIALLKSRYHEARLLALLILVDQHERGDVGVQKKIFNLYLAHTRCINNWDLVDLSAPNIVGPHVDPADLHFLGTLAESPLLWERRIAILATHHWIRQHEFRPVLHVAAKLLTDEHDLMHKAVGWMLREAGKRDEAVLLGFLRKHYCRLPRTTLRYAIERFTPAARARYLRGAFS